MTLQLFYLMLRLRYQISLQMKALQLTLTVFLFSLMGVTIFAQSAERTLVKSFNLKGNDSVVLDLKGEVDVQQWNSDLVRIQINIHLENGNDAVLKSLIFAGRYNLKGSDEATGYVIKSPGLMKEVTLKGNLLKERLSYTVFAPEDVLVQLSDSSATTLEMTKENSSSL